MEEKTYLISVNDNWKTIKAKTIKELILKIAEYTGEDSDLFKNAIVVCKTPIEYIEMYNHFAGQWNEIDDIYEVNNHIYGDT